MAANDLTKGPPAAGRPLFAGLAVPCPTMPGPAKPKPGGAAPRPAKPRLKRGRDNVVDPTAMKQVALAVHGGARPRVRRRSGVR
jgi:hypothetical protein